MKVLSIDLASKRSGWAVLDGSEVLSAGIIRPMGSKGFWVIDAVGGERVLKADKAGCWAHLVGLAGSVVVERSYVGQRASAVVALSRIRGYVDARCEDRGLVCADMAPSEWRRIVREIGLVGAWPAGREAKKALAVAVAAKASGLEGLGEDEAEAILLGLAWQATQV